ncbi:MAG: hypothetical protein ACI8TQ_002940 [Planctomycetota bacterium]|jgi:hypothetical protein
MITWATIFTLLGAWLTGHTVLGLAGLGTKRRARGNLERHATAILVGAALVISVVMHAVIASGPLTPTICRTILVLLAVPGIWFALRPGSSPSIAPAPDRIPTWGRLLLIPLVGFAVFAIFNAGSMPMHIFDTVYHFSYKAKLIYYEGFGTEAWTDVEGLVGRIITHPNYSPGIAVLNATVGWIGGRFDEDAFRALGSIFIVVPAIWLWVALRPRSWSAAFSASFMWVSLPILYYTKLPNNGTWYGSIWSFVFGMPSAKNNFPDYTFGPADGQMLDGGADLALAAFFFGALYHLVRCLPSARVESDRRDVVCGGLLLGAALLAKNEGLALTAVIVLAFTISLAAAHAFRNTDTQFQTSNRRALISLTSAVLLAFLCSTGWLMIRGDIPSIDENYPERMTPANLLENSHRWIGDEAEAGVLIGFWDCFTHVLRWNLLWPLFYFTLIWALFRPRELMRNPGLFAVLAVLGGSLLYALILLVTPWHLPMLFGTVIPGRLLVHLAPVVIFATISLLWRDQPETIDEPSAS